MQEVATFQKKTDDADSVERRQRSMERIATYERAFFERCTQQPVKHRLRTALTELFGLYDRFRRLGMENGFASKQQVSILANSQQLRPANYHYAGHRGPWIEEHFFNHWSIHGKNSNAIYIPIFWTNFYLFAQTSAFRPAVYTKIEESITAVLEEISRSDQIYFTVTDYEHTPWDWDLFPNNLLVYSGGGGGDIPIPLLMKDRVYTEHEKTIRCSFMGKLDSYSDQFGLRSQMRNKLANFATFGQGANWMEVMSQSDFSLAPRGLGPTSFRLYEAIALSSLPIYIWNDLKWLPYESDIDWSRFAVVVHQDDIGQIPELVASLEARGLQNARAYLAEIFQDYFTYEGTCAWILKSASSMEADVLGSLTSKRRKTRVT